MKELQALAKNIYVRLTGSSHNHDIVIVMGKIGAVRDPSVHNGKVRTQKNERSFAKLTTISICQRLKQLNLLARNFYKKFRFQARNFSLIISLFT